MNGLSSPGAGVKNDSGSRCCVLELAVEFHLRKAGEPVRGWSLTAAMRGTRSLMIVVVVGVCPIDDRLIISREADSGVPDF